MCIRDRVNIIPAISGESKVFKSSTLTVPSSFDLTSKMSNPATATLAGLVPWALSGIIIFVLLKSFRERWYSFIIHKPNNSPWAPANGANEKSVSYTHLDVYKRQI